MAGILFVFCAAGVNGSVDVSGDISADATWGLTSPAPDGTYIVTGDVTVTDGAELTIEAGVEVRFNQNVNLYVGGSSGEYGSLQCDGTIAQPVTMTSNQATHTPGYWRSLYFRENSDDSVLDYTIIEYGGNANSALVFLDDSDAGFMHCHIGHSSTSGVRTMGESDPSFSFSTVHDNGSYGFAFEGSGIPAVSDSFCQSNGDDGIYISATGFPEISDTEISDNNGYGIYCSAAYSMITVTDCVISGNSSIPVRVGANRAGFLSGNTFSANGADYIEVIGATATHDCVWEDQGLPFRISGEIYVRGQDGPDLVTTMYFQEGVELQFESGFGITVGHDSQSGQTGALSADGSGGDQIIFTGTGVSTTWNGIYFSQYSGDNSMLNNCLIEYSNTHGITSNSASLSLVDCEINESNGHGIHVTGGPCLVSISSSIISDNTGHGVYCNDSTSGIQISGGNIINNAADYSLRLYAGYCGNITGVTLDKDIDVIAQNITDDTTWEGQDTDYILSAGMTVSGQSGPDNVTTLTILEGAVLRFPSQARLYIGHDSDGSRPGGLIIEGTEMNPVILTADSDTPGPGSWGDVYFARYADDTLCELNYATIEYAGQNFSGSDHYAVHCNYVSPVLYGCVIRHAEHMGIYIDHGAPIIEQCTIFDTGEHCIYFNESDGYVLDGVVSDPGPSHDCIRLTGACEPEISGNFIAYGSNYGIYCQNEISAPYINGNTFTQHHHAPVYIYARNVTRMGPPANVIIESPLTDWIYVVGDTINSDSIWRDHGTPYYISNNIYVRGKDGPDNVTTLTLEPGVELQFYYDRRLHIGSTTIDDPGALIAVGTDTERITFTGAYSLENYWQGIYFDDYTDDSICLMEYCDVYYGGRSYENIHCNASSPTFRHCRSFFGTGPGFYAYNWSNPVLENCEFAYNSNHGLYIDANSNVILADCYFHHNESSGVHVNNSSNADMTDTVLSHNYYGLYCNGYADTASFTGCSFLYNTYPVRINAAQAHAVVLAGNSYTGNDNQVLYIGGGTITQDTLWEQYSLLPYYVGGDINVRGTHGPDNVTTLTLEPGIELRFGQYYQLYIGSNDSATDTGALHAVGEAGNRILFTTQCDYPIPGEWDGIYFGRYADDALCIMEYCDVEYGGYGSYENIYCYDSSPTIRNCRIMYGEGNNIYCTNNAAPNIENCEIAYASSSGIYSTNNAAPQVTGCDIYHNSSYGIYSYSNGNPTISSSTIRFNSSYGIYTNGTSYLNLVDCTIDRNGRNGLYCNSTSDEVIVNGCAFTNHGEYPVSLYADQADGIQNCTFSGNINEEIEVRGGYIYEDCYWQNALPYYVSSHIYIEGTDGPDNVTTLTLQEGCELRFSGHYLYVGDDSNFYQPGALVAVGTASEPIIITSHNRHPSPGNWSGIHIRRYADDSICMLDHCEISYASHNVQCTYASPTIRNCKILFASSSNIYSNNYSSPVIENCEISRSNSYGVYCNGNAEAEITNSSVEENSSHGIYVTSTSNVSVSNTSISRNGSYGLYCTGANDSAIVSNCAFISNNSYPIRMHAQKLQGITDCTYIDNGNQIIYVTAENISQDTIWPSQDIPYYITGHIYVRGQDGGDNVTALTIEPGAVVMFSGNYYFYIGHDSNSSEPGALIAEGSAMEPIVFTTASFPPSLGSWKGLYFAKYCDDLVTSLKHVIVEYGGNSDPYDNVCCNGSSPVLENCELRFGSGHGVNCSASDANPTLIDCHIHDNTSSGVYASPGNVQISGGIIELNPQYGVYISPGTSGSSSSVVGTQIRYNHGGYGIYVNGSNAAPLIRNCNIHDNNSGGLGVGVYVTGSALPIIGGFASQRNSFSNHVGYAVYNDTSSTCVDARYNFWGMAGGPRDNWFVADGCMNDGNENPGAERVSDDVDYSGWIDFDFTPTPILTEIPTPVPTTTPSWAPTFTATPACINDGDVNNDGVITIEDAQITYMIVLGEYTPTFEETCSADCTGEGEITIGDAQCMYMFYLGLACECADSIPDGKKSGDAKSPLKNADVLSAGYLSVNLNEIDVMQIAEMIESDYAVWIENISGCEGDLIEIPIRIGGNDQAIDAFGFSLHYCTDMLEYVGFETGRPDLEWIMIGCNEPATGEIRSAGFLHPDDALPAESNEILMTLKFKVSCAECRIGERCELQFSYLTDDLSEANGLGASFVYCELTSSQLTEEYLDGRTLLMPMRALKQ